MPSRKSKIASQEYVVYKMWEELKRMQSKLKLEIWKLNKLKGNDNNE